jgi:D-aspartate ligase
VGTPVSEGRRRTVTVFDADIPPGVAFIRSLARAGVAVVVGVSMFATAGRFSHHTTQVRRCPSVRRTDEFVGWLGEELDRGTIDLIAPTSDYVSFCVAEALENAGRKSSDVGHPDAARVRTALFKNEFATAMDEIGFPTPAWATPSSLDEAQAAAQRIGYPVVLKPRTHAGIGMFRGSVVRSDAELAMCFERQALTAGHTTVLAHDADVGLPIVQRYHDLGTVDVVSITGCLDEDGGVLALGHCRKLSQSPPRLGVGTMFEPIPEPPFTAAAVHAVREVLGSGLFELEVLVDRGTGEFWALDLNPRAFGQISLDIALGNDLPRLWYEELTGTELPSTPAVHPRPEFWHDTASTYAELAVRLLRGPDRRNTLDRARDRLSTPRVGAMFDRRDPLPGLVYGLQQVRHPRSFMKPILAKVEATSVRPHLSSAPSPR